MSHKDGDQMAANEDMANRSPWGVERNTIHGSAEGSGGHSFPVYNLLS